MTKITGEFLKGADRSPENPWGALFANLPIPPSSNNQYALVRRACRQTGKTKTYHIPSVELTQFKKQMKEYPFRDGTNFLLNKHRVREWVGKGHLLEARAYFFFKKEKLLTLKHTPKKLDVSNRIKAIHDSLCDLLGIDDCLFFKVTAEKVVCNPNLEESSWIELLPLT